MKTILCALFTIMMFHSFGQKNSVELYQHLNQLKTTGTVMYIAAHPDDENTRLISWLTNSQHLNTIYLSLTRGDGGQNLIGTEKGALLGLLRTQELLEARKVDGGKQWFTRANDFGYSKTATETLKIWDEEEVLADVVWSIRLHQPDVLITRFDPKSNGKTHGHHTASAMLAEQAFDLAGDPKAFPEQLKYVKTWQPERLFFNTSWWFYGSEEKFAKADKSKMISMDVGEFYPHLGLSNNEIASISRSKHACQGFGSALQRGSREEWLELLKGSMPQNNELMNGIDHSWKRYGLPQVDQQLKQLQQTFNFREPSMQVNELISIYNQYVKGNNNVPVYKHKEFTSLIQKMSGVYAEMTTKEPYVVIGDSIEVNYEFTNRFSKEVSLATLSITGQDQPILLKNIQPNEKRTGKVSIQAPKSNQQTVHYWLDQEKKGELYSYEKTAERQAGKPLGTSQFQYTLAVQFPNEEQLMTFSQQAIQYKFVDPAKGQIYEPLYTVPKFAVNLEQPNYLFSKKGKPIEVDVTVTAFKANESIQVTAQIAGNSKTTKTVTAKKAGEKIPLTFLIPYPQKKHLLKEIVVTGQANRTIYPNRLDIVNYEHIDKQFVFTKNKAPYSVVDLQLPDVKIAYIQGSGDTVPASLRQIGLKVDELNETQWSAKTLEKYDVVVLGIRAFNTKKKLAFFTEDLWEFARKGGTVITQYNTNRGLKTSIAPYQLELGRGRISEEDAELKFLQPSHPIFTTPNKITAEDFNDWVQERGLYFASEWDNRFTPLLEGNDEGEDAKQGALLVATVGEGHYVYTGLSFFRELPAGVPGAYRLFVNLLALGQDEKTK